jgi:methionine-rich copper-binding protein CopC
VKRLIVTVVGLLLLATAANAHTHLVASVPADKSEVATAPKEATLSFAEAVVLTSAKLEFADGTKTALAPLPAGAAKDAHLSLPPLKPGRYRILWRATSDDGHVMAGDLSFVVTGAASP